VDQTPELLRLPRSVLLAVWLDGVGTAGVTIRDLLKAVQGDDEPHAVRGPDNFGPAGSDLTDLVVAWAGGPRAVTAVVATPEDPDGLPGAVVEAIGGAEECMLIEVPDGAYAAVPEVVRFGSVLEPGHVVTWDVHDRAVAHLARRGRRCTERCRARDPAGAGHRDRRAGDPGRRVLAPGGRLGDRRAPLRA